MQPPAVLDGAEHVASGAGERRVVHRYHRHRHAGRHGERSSPCSRASCSRRPPCRLTMRIVTAVEPGTPRTTSLWAPVAPATMREVITLEPANENSRQDLLRGLRLRPVHDEDGVHHRVDGHGDAGDVFVAAARPTGAGRACRAARAAAAAAGNRRAPTARAAPAAAPRGRARCSTLATPPASAGRRRATRTGDRPALPDAELPAVAPPPPDVVPPPPVVPPLPVVPALPAGLVPPAALPPFPIRSRRPYPTTRRQFRARRPPRTARL